MGLSPFFIAICNTGYSLTSEKEFRAVVARLKVCYQMSTNVTRKNQRSAVMARFLIFKLNFLRTIVGVRDEI